MKNTHYRIIIALAALALACAPALAQTTDLMKGHDQRLDVRLGLFGHSQSGDQATVREFDGRRFDLWGLESLKSYGYDGDYQYWLDARNLLIGDEDLTLALGVRNELSVDVRTSALLHRLDRVPGANPYLTPLGLTGGNFTDKTPGGLLGIDRRVNEVRVALSPEPQKLILRTNWWQELERGTTQYNYRGSGLESVDFGVDRETDQGTLGADLRLGRNTALNYSLESIETSDSGKPAIAGGRPSSVVIPSIKTTSNLVRARSKLSDRLYFAGVNINRKRSNETAAVAGRSIDINSTSAALTFLASPTLTLSSRYRNYELDNHFGPALDSGGEATNVALSRKQRSVEVESDYTGIRKALLRLGFEHRKTERELADSFPTDPELEETVSPVTTSNIWRGSFRYNPTLKLNLSGRFEDWAVDDPAFRGSPGDLTKGNLNATYMINDRFVTYADYSRLHDKREELAGLDNRSTSSMVGAWFGINGKLTADALYANFKIDATTLWELAPNANDPVSTEDVPYHARNNEVSFGLNYAVTPKSSVYARYLNSWSDGKTLITELVPGSPTLPEGWNPVEVRENRWTIGFTRDLSEKDRLLAEFSVADWNDKIDPANDGRFNLWRLAWSTGF